MTENSRLIWDYVKENDGKDITAKDIVAATGLNIRTVTGAITMSFVRHKDKDKNIVPLMVRVPAEIVNPETGLHDKVSFIRLTDEGRAYDPDAVDAE